MYPTQPAYFCSQSGAAIALQPTHRKHSLVPGKAALAHIHGYDDYPSVENNKTSWSTSLPPQTKRLHTLHPLPCNPNPCRRCSPCISHSTHNTQFWLPKKRMELTLPKDRMELRHEAAEPMEFTARMDGRWYTSGSKPPAWCSLKSKAEE